MQRHPYVGRTAALATKHGKERQIGPPLWDALGLHILVPEGLDTDLLGTFSGEIPRTGSPAQVALQKARLGMQYSKLPLGLANEGSFGPHPEVPLLLVDSELLVFVDDERGFHVQETLLSEHVVAASCIARSIDELPTFLERTQFPTHGLIVRPHALPHTPQTTEISKGITDKETLDTTIRNCIAASPEGLALIETDLRAHMNPTRQRAIAQVAERLAQRLMRLCPACGTPGWGIVDVVRGLYCEWCGAETELVREELHGCPLCTHRVSIPRADGLLAAPAGQCGFCNP